MSSQVEHQSRTGRSEYREFKARDFYDSKGQHFIIWVREVDHAKDLLDPDSGNLTFELTNDNNNNRSHQRRTSLILADPFVHQSVSRLSQQAVRFGANTTTTSYSTGNATSGVLPAPSANSLTLLTSEVQHIGRAHYEKTDVAVDGWHEVDLERHEKTPKAYGEQLTITGEIVANGTAVPTGALILNAHAERVDDQKDWLVVERMPNGPGIMTDYNQLDGSVFGAETVANTTLVANNTVPGNATFLTVSLEQKDLGNGWGELKDVKVEEWPTLVSEVVDETTDSLIVITKTFVPAGTEGSFTAGNQTEVKEFDRLKSISINAQWKSAPAAGNESTAIVLPFTEDWQIPPVLVSATVHYVNAWAFVGDNNAYAEDLDLEFEIKDSYAVNIEGRLKTYYSATPAAVTPNANSYQPRSNTVIYAASWWHINGSQPTAVAQIKRWQTAPVLVPPGGITIDAPIWFTDGDLTVNSQTLTSRIAATATPPTGWTTMHVRNRKIKLGYYEVQLYQLNLPDPFA